jgi:purine-nucleoside phosphorylase
MNNLPAKLKESEQFIRSRVKIMPRVGIILGSGLGHLAQRLEGSSGFSYSDIPHIPASTVQGHSGRLLFGTLSAERVLVMQGRLHFYEGYSMDEITYPVRLMKALGVGYLIITAAAGALNSRYRRGDLVIIKDHINLMGENPLRGSKCTESVERFPDMGAVYDTGLRRSTLLCARACTKRAHEGVYMAVSGPSYETPAEIRAFRRLGGDVVGMSVVPEAVVAHQLGISVLGIAYVSNVACGSPRKPLSHDDVLAVGATVNRTLGEVIVRIVGTLSRKSL